MRIQQLLVLFTALSVTACDDTKASDGDGDGDDSEETTDAGSGDGEEVDEVEEVDPTADSDGDGYLDIWEIAEGTDPEDADSRIYTGGWPYNPDKDEHAADAPGRFDGDVGSKLARFSLSDQHGDIVDIYDYYNEDTPVLIDISAMWCGPCNYISECLAGGSNSYCSINSALPELINSEQIRWVTIIDQTPRGAETTVGHLEAWDEDYPNEYIAVLGGEGVTAVSDQMLANGWPTVYMFEADLTLSVRPSGSNPWRAMEAAGN
ncbi:MAG: hypothetical protein CL927_01815 [Deltaproteobacteria bacterium]|nr:hypothetical protein [Deltaproteobacteria bacterium]HCH66506.1 hypothetical protein [Deltaproteobacteria bacterium]|tara:strand:- start:16 stop:804 length:789 start_codon:yes stop_codon:yes gene_type:complete